jgi:hypothetical protein
MDHTFKAEENKKGELLIKTSDGTRALLDAQEALRLTKAAARGELVVQLTPETFAAACARLMERGWQ